MHLFSKKVFKKLKNTEGGNLQKKMSFNLSKVETHFLGSNPPLSILGSLTILAIL